eukprot:gnl/TRDRNA2_/TRDRNA2_159970_c0_seq2.p1 gnl/TRDRNA2_/TRDRNA2_159970_c0~~gnl/TRDRNA2_/TRDRNA2_159970_c0_seq2.p1  ORF type:complete len:131 (-),score=25.30 gnl/TRDRNA2_/TRDRNA2_159970_c0_seq2:66-458(-)
MLVAEFLFFAFWYACTPGAPKHRQIDMFADEDAPHDSFLPASEDEKITDADAFVMKPQAKMTSGRGASSDSDDSDATDVFKLSGLQWYHAGTAYLTIGLLALFAFKLTQVVTKRCHTFGWGAPESPLMHT